ncbi:MAG: hypothetical protein FP814_02510 [Desulfobacterium sp.]|nr:hypothetical protein [Desulfobacteraceae bacterium]MBA3035345.1 hypothetical protein [Desulfobacterium sp.]MBU3948952.1 hypothetical protein [Pseudomonadota bacterium]MBU4035521.1 hypothetical protein [Pseudomonadota bacterium]
MTGTLDSEEKRKLHSEINQLVNQRFVLNGAAITLFGVITAWAIPKNQSLPDPNAAKLAFTASILLIILLFALYLVSHLARLTTRTLTTYLIVRGESQWECDWKNYRDKKSYIAYTKSQTLLFLVLGFLSTIAPLIFLSIFKITLNPKEALYALVLFELLYTVFVAGMGFGNWFYPEQDIENRWNEVLNNNR